MEQIVIKTWGRTKEKHPDAVILVRHEHFYYTLKEDAHAVEKCGCLLRNDEQRDDLEYSIFLQGMLDIVLPKLIRNGNRVVITNVEEKEGGKQ